MPKEIVDVEEHNISVVDVPIEEASVEATDGERVSSEDAQEAEQFAYEIMKRAASLRAVKIDRGQYLRTTIRKYCPEIDPAVAVASTPIEAGVTSRDLDLMAVDAIDFETKKCAGLSFIAGIPGGAAMAGTIPADLAQYFAHVMRVEQKLAYLYGWQSFLDKDDEVDDETLMKLIVLMGVMMGMGSVASSINKFAVEVAQKGVAKTIERTALTKTFFYTPMKKVLQKVGVDLTKKTFANGVSKMVPVVGGAISGGLTYASFKPSAERLRRYLRALPTSGIDAEKHPDIVVLREQARAEDRERAVAQAKAAAGAAAETAGKVAAEAAGVAATAASDAAEMVGHAASDAANAADKAVRGALGATGSFLSGLASKAKK